MSAMWNEVTFNMNKGTIFYPSHRSIQIILCYVYHVFHNIQTTPINSDETHNSPEMYIFFSLLIQPSSRLDFKHIFIDRNKDQLSRYTFDHTYSQDM